MSFDWNKESEGPASMGEGYHFAECVKVMRSNKEGKPHTSKDGDPQIYSVWANADGAESLVIFTLSVKSNWVLADCLKKCGADLKRMTDAGVTPEHFEEQPFAEKNLMGRKCWVYAEQKGKYTNLSFIDKDNVPDRVLAENKGGSGARQQHAPTGYERDTVGAHEAIGDDDIPF